ncbi:penicillin-binding protein 2 [uncultured Litoreibacter sp.]|uniref:peptidoglycan D,D-transpeptidase FtsI family protein n=1 Tax=uncultured Litoreibacter sp. TaxID=1392394 RepID=UPI002628EF64|nr:penicillin-binding protein 2 [uncultured Litoreibacter sp.]
MIRTPLRPLARILPARLRGENTDRIEADNIRQRHEEMRDRARARAESRLLFVAVLFLAGFSVIGARMTVLASSEAVEPQASASSASIVAQRANIVDRNGRVLATNLITNSLYAQPKLMVEPERAAKELAAIFPGLKEERLLKDFTGARKFLWVKKKISPEQMQAVHDIGEPGLLFGPREMRLYPNGRLAAHVLGGASFGREGVHSAEVIGTAGVEKAFDDFLRDPALEGAPLRLSIDMTIQSAMRRVLDGGMKLMNAKGATAVLMKVDTGEVVSMVSLPDFDPNTRPRDLIEGDPSDSPLFNRAVQGVYELGSTFKIFAAAQALELKLVNPTTMLDTKGPMRWGRYKIRDFSNYGDTLSVTDVIVKSSNIGTARMALNIGAKRQKEFLGSMGFFEPSPVELVEAPGAKPLLPKKWSDISTMTVSYGHGMAASPLHLASAYATVVGGGTLVKPTLLKVDSVKPGPRVMSEQTSRQAREMLHQVVERGTASFMKGTGYMVGGKTGTADKPKPRGGYHKDKVIATFASAFPMNDPQYVLIVTLDEPSENSGKKPRRTAGWTAVPVAAEIVKRTAPLLGLRPIESGPATGVTTVKY